MPRKVLTGDAATGMQDVVTGFVHQYLVDLNATQAYRRVAPHVTERTASVAASRLLRRADVQAAIAEGKRRQIAAVDLSATRVLEELRRIAFFDPVTMFDEQGRLLPIRKMPPEARSVLASFKVARANLDRTDGKRSREWLYEIKLNSKNQALEMLARHFKLLVDVVQVEGDWEKRVARIRKARERMQLAGVGRTDAASAAATRKDRLLAAAKAVGPRMETR